MLLSPTLCRNIHVFVHCWQSKRKSISLNGGNQIFILTLLNAEETLDDENSLLVNLFILMFLQSLDCIKTITFIDEADVVPPSLGSYAEDSLDSIKDDNEDLGVSYGDDVDKGIDGTELNEGVDVSVLSTSSNVGKNPGGLLPYFPFRIVDMLDDNREDVWPGYELGDLVVSACSNVGQEPTGLLPQVSLGVPEKGGDII
mmetsp:Transcript_16087/g.23526  ORF Transcript_16087/g.23526 Transcript_16087/m.23526 type:complete len:200 (-) Transcript_16087:405-1004(-)